MLSQQVLSKCQHGGIMELVALLCLAIFGCLKNFKGHLEALWIAKSTRLGFICKTASYLHGTHTPLLWASDHLQVT